MAKALHACVNHCWLSGLKVYICCTEDSPQGFVREVGKVLAAWWKGKWSHQKSDTDSVGNLDIKFDLGSTDALIYVGSKLLEVSEAIQGRMASAPAKMIKVNYHIIEDAPEGEGNATYQILKVEHHMVWTAQQGAPTKKTDDGEAPMMDFKHVAAAIPASKWEGTFTGVAWSYQWHDTGLTPVRPQVILKKPMALAPGECVLVAG